MTFLADCMLGKLARWLRILGYDTAYDNQVDDDDLLVCAGQEERILLTRDRPLFERAAPVHAILIESNELDGQLAQLVNELNLDLGRETFTRCLQCNVSINPVEACEVASTVPPFVLKRQSLFYKCPSCQKIYWPGTHTKRMETRLANIQNAC